MSRIGRKPITIPPGVKVQVDGSVVRAEGPKGRLGQPLPPDDEKAKAPAKINVGLPVLSLDGFGFRIFKRK